MDRGTGMELERANGYSGARGGFYETLNCYTMTLCHARNSRLPATVSQVRPKRDAIRSPAARTLTHTLLPSAQPLSPSQLLGCRQRTTSPSSRSASQRIYTTQTQPLSIKPAILRVRTVAAAR